MQFFLLTSNLHLQSMILVLYWNGMNDSQNSFWIRDWLTSFAINLVKQARSFELRFHDASGDCLNTVWKSKWDLLCWNAESFVSTSIRWSKFHSMEEKQTIASNYTYSRRSMEINLASKGKLGFVTGTITRPDEDPLEFRCISGTPPIVLWFPWS